MEAKAVQKYIITSPRKLREVVFLIKKMKPAVAIEQLPFSYKRAAEPLVKVIKTAIANATQKGASSDELIFKEIQINEGPRLRRFRAASRGRAKPYKKRMSHIRVVVMTQKPEAKALDVPKSETPKEENAAPEKEAKKTVSKKQVTRKENK